MISAPPATSACISGTVSSGAGSPAVMKVTSAVLFCAFKALKVAAMLDMSVSLVEVQTHTLCDRMHVLVTPARQVGQYNLILRQRGRQLGRVGQGVRRLQRRND